VKSWNVTHSEHPYSKSDFVKECNVVVVVLEPNYKNLEQLIEKCQVHAKLHKGAYSRLVQMLKLLCKVILKVPLHLV